MIPGSPEPERGFVLAVLAQGADAGDELAEVKELARTAGVEPVGEVVQHRARPAQRTYVGKGKLEELKERFRDEGAESVIVDDELDPAQQRFLENALNTRVIDRTQLILDIFAQHATSAEGKLQVELAQLEYNLPRMRGMWQHLERLGGGVGTRGPGESQLETDRRLARRRITQLRRRLKELAAPARDAAQGAAAHRDADDRARGLHERRQVDAAERAHGLGRLGPQPALPHARPDDARLRARRPPVSRHRHGRLHPSAADQLVEGFASTLEETLVADLILHVIDASADDDEQDRQRVAVEQILGEIGASEVAYDVVLNKIDQVDPLGRRRLANRFPGAAQVSSVTGEGLDDLRAELAHRFDDRWERVRMLLPVRGGRQAERAVRARHSDRGARGHRRRASR